MKWPRAKMADFFADDPLDKTHSSASALCRLQSRSRSCRRKEAPVQVLPPLRASRLGVRRRASGKRRFGYRTTLNR